MDKILIKLVFILVIAFVFTASADAQSLVRELKMQTGGVVEIINRFGRVEAAAAPKPQPTSDTPVSAENKFTVSASSTLAVAESELKVDASGGKMRIEVVPAKTGKRIDVSLTLPARSRVRIETTEGEVLVSGDMESIEVTTGTGTIAADVPTDDLNYTLFWTESRPRFLSDIELAKVKERSGGKFEIKGHFADETDVSEQPAVSGGSTSDTEASTESTDRDKPKTKDQKSKSKDRHPASVSLNFTTARGIVLLNVPPNEVMRDLRERPLTNAAKAIIRSGNSDLMDAIRRASPKYFGDYAKTLPPARSLPSFSEREAQADAQPSALKRATVRVTDQFNRAIAELTPADFQVTENNAEREVVSVRPVTAPFNLVLLLDVSGSVDNYVNFIRKAARSFVDTVDKNDRISIVLFNDDVKVLSKFTTDKQVLSESLDTFDAGGGTAYYDAVAYTLAETLRPMRGDRTAIVVLTDGDDNRSFLPFDSLLGSIEESGALIYPLYVPSALIAATNGGTTETAIDPLRNRYISLSTKAEGEGERLAKVSGGVYYPITQLSQIQTAYDDIVVQLRTAYDITYRSQIADASGTRASPRLKVKVNKPNAYVSLGQVVKVQ